jgi:hypothetical protein
MVYNISCKNSSKKSIKGANMTTVEKISQQSRNLPEVYQAEVLDFVEFLTNKAKAKKGREFQPEEQEWFKFSLTQAMQGLEDEEIPSYTDADLIEKWK